MEDQWEICEKLPFESLTVPDEHALQAVVLLSEGRPGEKVRFA